MPFWFQRPIFKWLHLCGLSWTVHVLDSVLGSLNNALRLANPLVSGLPETALAMKVIGDGGEETKGYKLAKNLTKTQALDVLWDEEKEGKDVKPGTFADLLGYGSVHLEQTRDIISFIKGMRPELVIKNGLLELYSKDHSLGTGILCDSITAAKPLQVAPLMSQYSLCSTH
ncbi:uncharacterized protein RAG0_12386 [Rhynchosporium agropyri]|uniref:Uncharacterized protein n=1 Tax=Rhynchosporium agropyri TaxID=914238 RepID=A0A1E1L850_9HELO|nr:uncharacterized protein RAG0_12386 [Rhynchosporium agropyri]